MKTMTITIHSYDRDEDMEVEIPSKYDVCHRCEGRGTHVDPRIDGNGLTREDFAEDPDFAEDYFNGVYDTTCYECKGLRVVKVPNLERCKLSHRMALNIHDRQEAQRAQWDREDAYTRRMECGYY